jgi:hypothetical protein
VTLTRVNIEQPDLLDGDDGQAPIDSSTAKSFFLPRSKKRTRKETKIVSARKTFNFSL